MGVNGSDEGEKNGREEQEEKHKSKDREKWLKVKERDEIKWQNAGYYNFMVLMRQ